MGCLDVMWWGWVVTVLMGFISTPNQYRDHTTCQSICQSASTVWWSYCLPHCLYPKWYLDVLSIYPWHHQAARLRTRSSKRIPILTGTADGWFYCSCIVCIHQDAIVVCLKLASLSAYGLVQQRVHLSISIHHYHCIPLIHACDVIGRIDWRCSCSWRGRTWVSCCPMLT